MTEFCSRCGRPLTVLSVERTGFSTDTGEPTYREWVECPRFGRGWRNLWMGGFHDSHENRPVRFPGLRDDDPGPIRMSRRFR